MPASNSLRPARTDTAEALPAERARALGQTPRAPLLNLDRVLPNSVEAEMAVLGAMLLKPQEAGPLVRERINEAHFYYGPHQLIFREIVAQQDALQSIDLITLTQRLQDKGLLEQIGGAVYLTDLYTRVPTAAHVEDYVEIVHEKFLLRRLVAAAADIVSRCFEQQDQVKTWLDEVEQHLFEITTERSSSVARPVRNLIKDAMASIERLYDQRGAVTGLATGFRDLDRLTSGLHDGNMIVIAARPSMGKTALAMNIAEHVAIDQNLPVGVFSLEMSSEELVKRMLCSRAKVNLRAVRDGFLSAKDFHPLTAAASQLMKAPIYIDDSASLTIGQVRSKARRLKSQHDIRLLVVDYLQLMRSPSRRSELNRQVEIAEISSGVKALAKELRIPVVVLSQLNRQPEQREGGKPRLADLRESGAIEQDADVVGLLVRPEMYADDDQHKSETEGEATLVIAKQRNGPTGEVSLTFLKEYTRFVDRAKLDHEDVPAMDRSAE
jgi:replicative DNA helicase